MFVSIELAARIDRAEARLSQSIGQAAVANKARPDAFVEEIGGGVAVYAGPASPMNKMIGVGFAAQPLDDQLEAIEKKFAGRRVPLQVEVSTLANPAFVERLSRRGYVLQGFENVLGRPIGPDDGSAHRDRAIEVGVTKKNEGARWLDVMLTSFLSPDEQGVQAEP